MANPRIFKDMRQEEIERSSAPLISIIVTSYSTDRVVDLSRLIESVGRQNYAHIELIFVGERDARLSSFVKQSCVESGVRSFKVLFNSGKRGLSAARNVALPEANGTIVAFVDDDVILPESWGYSVAQAYEKFSDAIGITGPIVPSWENSKMNWFPKEFEWLISCSGWVSSAEPIVVRNVWGANFSFKHEVFEKVGPFDTDFGFPIGTYEGSLGEDNEFSFRAIDKLAKRIIYDPQTLLYHRIHRSKIAWRFIIRRSFWLGYSRRVLQKRYSLQKRDILEPENQFISGLVAWFFHQVIHASRDGGQFTRKRLQVGTISLICVGLGYLWGLVGGT